MKKNHSRLWYKISESNLLSADEKKKALKEVERMENDRGYSVKVAFERSKILQKSFIWDMTEAGYEFWSVIDNITNGEL